MTGTTAFFDGPQGVQRLPPLAQRLHTDFATDARFDNPRAVQVRLQGFDLAALATVGRRVRDLFAEHSAEEGRIRQVVNDAYVADLARGVAGRLGGRAGIAPRLYLRKLVAEVLDRVDQFADFDPRRHYAPTIDEREMTKAERAAACAADVDDVEPRSVSAAFDALHPALRYHIVSTLGWPDLRPTQAEAVEPVMAGEDALLLAPTAGGKTEAAVFPLISRIAVEGGRGVSAIYVCPLKALLNNLAPRLDRYAARRPTRWPVARGCRRARQEADAARPTRDPPDHAQIPGGDADLGAPRSCQFSGRCPLGRRRRVHAFAGDDRGWHLLFLLSRLERLTGRQIQRIGLTATVGNPTELLAWLTLGRGGRVLGPTRPVADGEVTADHVGSVRNAVTVIARLHRGGRRLVFADRPGRASRRSRRGSGRQAGFRTFVSHASLSLDERRQAEDAFVAEPNCVIVRRHPLSRSSA